MTTETEKTSEDVRLAALRCGDWLAAIDPGREYYSQRSDSWMWIDGKDHWWEIFVVFHNGFHGGGGACITERWRWNGSSENIRQDPKNLSYEDTIALVTRLLSANNVHEPRSP